MKRNRKTQYRGARYPNVVAEPDRRRVLRGLGLAAGATILSASSFRCFRWDGGEQDDDYSDDDAAGPWTVRLPSAESRILYFDPQGFIGYHVEYLVANADLTLFIEETQEGLLGLLDDILGAHERTVFATPETVPPLENELIQAVVDAYQMETGHLTADLLAATLVIDLYDEEEEMMGEPEG